MPYPLPQRTAVFALALSSALAVFASPTLANPLAPVEGQDYTLVEPPVETRSGDKIEVVEVFSYSCSHCAHLQPQLGTWKQTLPADVKFEYLPSAHGGVAEAYARAFYTAETMGALDKTHEALFVALHEERRPISKVDDLVSFYADHGLDKEQFLSTMQSFAVDAKIIEARTRLNSLGVSGTPTLFVDGKYRIMAPREGGFTRMLQITDALIVKAREERATRQSGATAAGK